MHQGTPGGGIIHPWKAWAHWERERLTIFTCLYPYTVQTRLSRDQRPTKPASRLGTGRGVGGNLSAIEILNTVEKHEWTIKKKKKKKKYLFAQV